MQLLFIVRPTSLNLCSVWICLLNCWEGRHINKPTNHRCLFWIVNLIFWCQKYLILMISCTFMFVVKDLFELNIYIYGFESIFWMAFSLFSLFTNNNCIYFPLKMKTRFHMECPLVLCITGLCFCHVVYAQAVIQCAYTLDGWKKASVSLQCQEPKYYHCLPDEFGRFFQKCSQRVLVPKGISEFTIKLNIK